MCVGCGGEFDDGDEHSHCLDGVIEVV
jgi:hypothetical protein